MTANGEGGGQRIAGAADPKSSIRGRVELLSSLLGVEGWAVDLAHPSEGLEIELWAGDRKIGSCWTGSPRADLSEELGAAANPGFSFGNEVLGELKMVVALGNQEAVEIRVAGSTTPLPVVSRSPGAQRSDAAESGSEIDLLARLSHLRGEANRIRERPLRPLVENNVGYIEAAAIDEGGLVWLVGWVRTDALVDRPVVVLDSTKIPAGFAYTLMPRGDLPPGAAGIIGVLQTDWRPTPTSKPFLFINEDNQQFIEGLEPFNLVSKTTLLNHCRDLWKIADFGHAAALKRLMQQVKSWSPLPEDMIAERAAVEEVLVLPGFGCFVTGWVVSPTKEVDRLALKIGASVLISDPTATSTIARPDLAHIYRGIDRMLDHAGFTTALVGDVSAADMAEATLKVIYRDGTSSNHAVPAGQIRRLGQTVSIQRVLDFFPTIANESFFNDFARALRMGEQARSREVHFFEIAHCQHALIFSAPADRSDIFLMFDGLRNGLRGLSPKVGAVIVAGQDENRSLIVRLFNELSAHAERPMSLVFSPDRRLAAYSIPAMAARVGFERFLFVSKTVVLSASGWQSLGRFDGRLTFVEIEDPVREFATGDVGFECFGWSVAEFAEFLGQTEIRLGGLHLSRPPARLLDKGSVVPKGALRIRIPVQTPIVEAINRAAEIA